MTMGTHTDTAASGEGAARVEAMFYEPKDAKAFRDAQDSPIRGDVFLPTLFKVMREAGYPIDKASDLGCGAGYFTVPMTEVAKRVYGIDNSPGMLDQAELHPRVHYQLGDIFSSPNDLPRGMDFTFAPFMTGYAQSVADVQQFARNAYDSLNPGGVLLLISPTGGAFEDKRWGFTTPGITGPIQDLGQIKVHLFNAQGERCGPEITNTIFSLSTLESAFTGAGFEAPNRITPVVSPKPFGPEAVEKYQRETSFHFLKFEKPPTPGEVSAASAAGRSTPPLPGAAAGAGAGLAQ